MPYHPICKRLVEGWNGTLKSMLKRHRLINPVLFAYGEAKPRRLEVGEQIMILMTDSTKLLMQWRGPYIVQDKDVPPVN